jgi:predicted ATPase/class 3 adenylate cyclase
LAEQSLPSGTVTFLLTDIEGSTGRWESAPDAMRAALAAHDATLREVIGAAGGHLFKHTGDGVVAAFTSPRAAVDAAIAAQRRLALPVRMGLCTGEAELRDGDYFGPPLNRAARIMAAGHAGQVLLAGSTAALIEACNLVDLGEHRLRGLGQRQRLFQVRAEGLREVFPPLNTLDSRSGNLPTPPTALLGRDQELAVIATLLASERLVTLTGVGGVGKTRLMLGAAEQAAPAFPDGVWLCELAAIEDAGAVVSVVAASLGVGQQRGKSLEQSLVEALAGRVVLLVLDNCEHLIEPVARLVRLLLARCARLRVLATGREALSIDGERIQPVAPLATAADGASPAVALFVERARAVAPSFDPTRDPQSVNEICRRLDGIPLAIELAAARVRAMSPRQIRDRLDERFRLLGGARRALGRQQTLAQAMQWSYDLLGPAERTVLARAAVFAGGFSLEAAEAVCSGQDIEPIDVLDLIDSLLRKSLLTVNDSGDSVRYGMLETIRQFASEQGSDQQEGARRRHADYFADSSDRLFAQWLSPQQGDAHRWLEGELDNLRVAFRWTLDRHMVDPAARIASNIGDMARFILREEAAGWAAEILDLARAHRHPRLIVLLTWAASSAWASQRLEEARRLAGEAVALLDDPAFEPFAFAYADLAQVALFEGDRSLAVAHARAGAAHPADRRDRFCAAYLPYVLAQAGEIDEARRIADETLALAVATGIPSSIFFACWSKGVALADSDPASALASLETGLDLARRSGARFGEGLITIEIANLQARTGEPRAAIESLLGLAGSRDTSPDAFLIANALSALILLFFRLGRPDVTATLYGALPESIERGSRHDELSATIGRAREALDEAAFDGHRRRGAAMTLRDVSDYARRALEEELSKLP